LDDVIDAARNGFGGQSYTPRDKFMPGRPMQELSDSELQLIANYL
jgi:hypothetical protein